MYLLNMLPDQGTGPTRSRLSLMRSKGNQVVSGRHSDSWTRDKAHAGDDNHLERQIAHVMFASVPDLLSVAVNRMLATQSKFIRLPFPETVDTGASHGHLLDVW